MGAVKNGSKFNGVAIGGVIVNGFAKGGQVVYKKEGFDISTKAVFDFATTQGYTLPTNKNAFDTLIRDMKSIGIWDLLDNFYLFTGDGGNNFKRINLINPNKYQATYFGGLEITADGVKGNGTNAYINTNFNPALLEIGQKYQQNNASRGMVLMQDMGYANNNIQQSSLDSAGGDRGINGMVNTLNNISRINQFTNTNTTSFDYGGSGFKGINRINSVLISCVNKSTSSNIDSNSAAIEGKNQYVLYRYVGGGYGTQQFGCYFMGSSISFEISQNFRTIFNKYLSSIGLTPIA